MCTSLVELWRACGVSQPEHGEGLKPGQVLVHALRLDCGSMKAVWPFFPMTSKPELQPIVES